MLHDLDFKDKKFQSYQYIKLIGIPTIFTIQEISKYFSNYSKPNKYVVTGFSLFTIAMISFYYFERKENLKIKEEKRTLIEEINNWIEQQNKISQKKKS